MTTAETTIRVTPELERMLERMGMNLDEFLQRANKAVNA